MVALSIACALLAVVLLTPTAADLCSVLRIVMGAARSRSRRTAHGDRLLLLVPAHDEELSLPACLDSLKNMRYDRARRDIVVIADNCTDRTADIARAAGVRCLVRHAPTAPGKPHAIAWALSRVPLRDYDGVVIVDADTQVDRDFATHLAHAGPLAAKAVQPYNGVLNRSENALTRMASILSSADHDLAYALKTRAGLNVPLSAGMCVGSDVLAATGWTAYSVCEDWEVYATLTARGVTIEGVPSARLYAQEASSLRAGATQRKRWTAGKLAVLATHIWPLLRSTRIGWSQKLDAVAELSRPGPVLHLCLAVVAGAATAVLRPPAAGWLMALLLASLLRTTVYAIVALGRDPEPGRAIAAFAFLPVYAIWRIWTALTTLTTLGDRAWVRTARSNRSDVLPTALTPRGDSGDAGYG